MRFLDKEIQRHSFVGGSKIYHNKEKNREYIKLHRHYKQEIYLSELKSLTGNVA